jgi:D-glycerate 3-kinase
MLGFRPVPDETLSLSPDMRQINSFLADYRDMHAMFDTWVVLAVDDATEAVFEWRLEAELGMRERRGTGLSDDEVRDFVSRFLPAYRAYLPALYAEGPDGERSWEVPLLKVGAM